MRQVLLGARVFTGEHILDGHAVVLEAERIVAVVPRHEAPVGVTARTLPSESLLVPGFIDLQVNGAGGVLFNESPTVDAALAIATTMRRTGTTGLLPTFITDAPDLTARACEAASEAMARPGGGVLGIHLEGPFISPGRAGVHAPRYIRQPEASDLESLTALAERLSRAGGRLLMTLAPERVEDTFLRRLSDAGAVLFAGHTAASFERTLESIAAGVRGFTHLFNAMPPVLNRQPGPVMAGFSADEAWCGVIVDGHHVHPANLRQLLKAKPRGKVLLVTDAMPPVGTHETTFTLYGHTILRRDGRLVTEDGTLAGADIDMSAAVRNCIHLLGVPLEEALRMASLYPAQVLGLEGRLGMLAAGHRADLTLLREDLSVQATWVGGIEQWH
ncbi:MULTISPECIES: N-acetylglucosamine-6-phosphate deacetylase [Myxococcus]|uniref:N-acetylglucosamine-6-phosphate deacetylase n=1 Tax=Myxococcus llanfairpwllgwyngyllgogerychwyrndrobwllllantysiliogogogochensis TaxID=2590453 RepID=A0A540WXF7_9BACT|nr:MULTISPECIES: N-acetylglucosamine-6-phosphate deacetylase [Myxococcus]NTX03097.1 N-acetylglucosamine-6-phosphate deacetylase [Myxococcus sp. CA040A]TQF13692.1 N-acetylglucosamine-6-phosphate deacetylase [Myxococcus llanfairpwllgwyngyllgogerychwyrndrobwllllantysiliogogogochensis]